MSCFDSPMYDRCESTRVVTGLAALSMLCELERTELKLADLGPEQPDLTGMDLTSLHPFPAMRAQELHARTTAPSGWARSPSCAGQQKNKQKVLGHEQSYLGTLLNHVAPGLPAHAATWPLLWEILGYPEMTNLW